MGLSRNVSEIVGDFSRKSQNFPIPIILRLHWKCSPRNWAPALGFRKQEWWATGSTKKFDGIFSHMDAKHQRVRRTTDRHRAAATTAFTMNVAR